MNRWPIADLRHPRAAVALCAVGLGGAIALIGWAGPAEAMPLRAASVIALTGPIIVIRSGSADHRTLARITGTIATVSLAVTVWMRVAHPVNITDPSGDRLRVLAWSLVETVALAVLIVLLVRSAPRRTALVGTLVATLAEAAVALRLVPQWGLGVQAFWVITWSLAAISAAALGLVSTHTGCPARAIDPGRPPSPAYGAGQ